MRREFVVFGSMIVLAGCRAKPAGQVEQVSARMTLNVSSTSFTSGGSIPDRFTGDGANRSPALIWSGAPAKAKSALLLVEDPDAPQATPFVHWIVANLPPDGSLNEAQTPPGVQGTNGLGTVGYSGPKPPPGYPHHYHFRVFALDEVLDLSPGFSRDEALAAVKSHSLAEGDYVGTYRAK